MAHLTLDVQHKLGKHEALRRLQEKLASSEYRRQLSDLQEAWKDGNLTFSFKVVGTKVSGTVSVGETDVCLALVIPFAAMLFKSAIQSRVRAEVETLLH